MGWCDQRRRVRRVSGAVFLFLNIIRYCFFIPTDKNILVKITYILYYNNVSDRIGVGEKTTTTTIRRRRNHRRRHRSTVQWPTHTHTHTHTYIQQRIFRSAALRKTGPPRRRGGGASHYKKQRRRARGAPVRTYRGIVTKMNINIVWEKNRRSILICRTIRRAESFSTTDERVTPTPMMTYDFYFSISGLGKYYNNII